MLLLGSDEDFLFRYSIQARVDTFEEHVHTRLPNIFSDILRTIITLHGRQDACSVIIERY